MDDDTPDMHDHRRYASQPRGEPEEPEPLSAENNARLCATLAPYRQAFADYAVRYGQALDDAYVKLLNPKFADERDVQRYELAHEVLWTLDATRELGKGTVFDLNPLFYTQAVLSEAVRALHGLPEGEALRTAHNALVGILQGIATQNAALSELLQLFGYGLERMHNARNN